MKFLWLWVQERQDSVSVAVKPCTNYLAPVAEVCIVKCPNNKTWVSTKELDRYKQNIRKALRMPEGGL